MNVLVDVGPFAMRVEQDVLIVDLRSSNVMEDALISDLEKAILEHLPTVKAVLVDFHQSIEHVSTRFLKHGAVVATAHTATWKTLRHLPA